MPLISLFLIWCLWCREGLKYGKTLILLVCKVHNFDLLFLNKERLTISGIKLKLKDLLQTFVDYKLKRFCNIAPKGPVL